MAKDSITDFDNTAGNNTDIQSVNIDENCPASGINNAIRELMADLADVNDGTVALTSPQAGSLTVTGDLTVDTDTLYVDSTNNRVGIGTTSPTTAALDVHGTLDVIKATGSGGNSFIRFADSDASSDFSIGADDGSGAGAGAFIVYDRNNTAYRMIVDSSGRINMGTTSAVYSAAVLQVKQTDTSSGNNGCIALQNQNASGASGVRTVIFLNSTGNYIGGITNTSTATAYNTSSDYRLKENDVDMTGAIARVKQLQPKRFNFIADADTTVDGFMAHEVQTVVPEAISGTHNEVDDDGNPVYQGIDQSKLVPLLTGALQEAIAKIEALETRVTALENA